MSSFVETKAEIINFIKARTPLVIIDTSERERIEKALRQISQEISDDIYYYTDSGQVQVMGKSGETSTDDNPLGFFLNKMKKNRKLNIVLGDVQNITSDSLYARELVSLLYKALETDSVVMIITSDNVWERIRGFGMTVTLSLPNGEERCRQIESFIKKYGSKFNVEWTEDDVLHASALLKGFTEIQIENILSTEVMSQGALLKKRIHVLDKQKRRLYGKSDAVQYIDVDPELRVSGMDNLKKWLDNKKQIFFMPDEKLKEYDLTAPKGILLVGVPGCGKSLTAKLIARQWGLPLFRFDIGSVYDKWVGGSEKKMRESLRFIENVSPCILWIDEIEKGLSGSDSENDTAKRVLGEFLFWMQESNTKVFMVATANNVRSLPYELYRKGRFSELFFVGLPDDNARYEILKQYIEKSLHKDFDRESLQEIIDATDGFSNSDIEAMVKEVAQNVLIEGDSIDIRSELLKCAETVIPISRVNRELVSEITEWSKERTLSV